MESRIEHITVIKPAAGLQFIDFSELRQYKDLFYYLVWRNIKAVYAQTILGLSWAIVQPVVQILIFTIIFGKIAKISSDGVPYVLFVGVGIIPWTYMSTAISASSGSLVSGQHMLGKIYFPRLIYPVVPSLSKLLDFIISILVLFPLFLWYGITPSWSWLLVPYFFLLMMTVSIGAGLWFSAMAIRFRDVNHAMPFFIRMLMYSAPVVYSASSIPAPYRVFYSLNPIVSVIEGFRYCLLGLSTDLWYILPGSVVGILLLISGVIYFRHMEPIFVDVI
jgi:lipopolysaccharide transport system permease protein